jgi:hypothetical protein
MTKDTDFTKSERKLLRELTGYAWEGELGAELMKLLQEFHAWQAGRLNVFELSDKVHQFHDGTARELYGRYASDQAEPWKVARAIALGFVSRDRAGENLIAKLAPHIAEYSRSSQMGAEDAKDADQG